MNKYPAKEERLRLYQNLPEEIKEVFTSPETGKKTVEIGEKYKLHIDNIGKLSELIGLVLLGIIKPRDLQNHIQTHISLEDSAALNITKDIEQHILMPVRNQILGSSSKKSGDVYNEDKAIKISETKKTTIDPYREPLE